MSEEKYATLNIFQKVDFFFFGGKGTYADRIWYYGTLLLCLLISITVLGVGFVWNTILAMLY